MKMEMENFGVDFDILEDNQQLLVGWKKVTGHLVWDVKMDFTQKASLVKDRHKTPDLKGGNFAGVISRVSIIGN